MCVCGWYSEVPLPPQRVYNAEAGQFTEPTAADLEHQHNMQRQICDLMQNLFPDRTVIASLVTPLDLVAHVCVFGWGDTQ
jgi:hypothetical protein